VAPGGAGMSVPRRGRGMLLGKFLPPHLGHKYLIDFAAGHCAELTVLMCSIAAEPIPGVLRDAWLREMCPGVRIVHHTDELPQQPAGPDDARFWALWRASVRRFCPQLDYVYASEAYGERLARELEAEFVPVDRLREVVPVSASAIRARPMQHWRYIPEPVRPYFVRRVVLSGPESVGKSTLARDLAWHFGTIRMHEFARGYLERWQGRCDSPERIEGIARGQAAGMQAAARQAERVLLCDTDLLTTKVWSEFLFGQVPAWLATAVAEERPQLTLLPELAPWVDDGGRVQRDDAVRTAFRTRLIAELERLGRPWLPLSGSYAERLACAVAAVERLLAE